jgi:hypothetical protein
MSNLRTRDHQKFVSLIKEMLGDHLYPYDSTKSPGELTIGEIVRGPSGASSRVIFFYDSPGPDKKHPKEVILLRPPVPWVWPYKGIYSNYANKSNLAKMGADQQQKLNDNPGTPQQLFELNWTLTPQTPDIVGEAVARYKALSRKYPFLIATIQTILAILGKSYKRPSWHSLDQLSRQANATLRDFVIRHSDKKINSLNVDFFQDGGAVELAIEMSRRACAQQTAFAAAATAAHAPATEEAREPVRV